VYRELYKSELTFSELGKTIAQMTPVTEELTQGGLYYEQKNISYITYDPALDARSSESGQSGSEILSKALRDNGITAAMIPANNNRKYGWGVMREYLRERPAATGDTTAGIVWFDTCFNAVRTIPEQIYSTTHLEDLDTDGEDHCSDDTRYGLVSMKTRPSDPDTEPKKIMSASEQEFNKKMKRLKQLRQGYSSRFTRI
jgi:hypothetical protein